MIVTADDRRRVTLPKSVKPGDVFDVEPDGEGRFKLTTMKKVSQVSRYAKGKMVMGPDGWLVWDGELVMDPVEALRQCRAEEP
jgi:hypothetical protein